MSTGHTQLISITKNSRREISAAAAVYIFDCRGHSCANSTSALPENLRSLKAVERRSKKERYSVTLKELPANFFIESLKKSALQLALRRIEQPGAASAAAGNFLG